MSLESTVTRWATTRVAPTRNAPFAGLSASNGSTPSAGGITPTGGVALVILVLGGLAVWSEINKPKHRWP